MKFDVVIIGGGPSGAVTALKTPSSMSVLVVEKRLLLDKDHATEHEKSCGGMLDPSAQKALAHLGYGIPKKVMQDPQVFGVKAVDFESRMERFYQRNYVNINRPLLDSMLLHEAARRDNVTVWQGAILKTIREEQGRPIVTIGHDGAVVEVEAGTLVGCDGGSSKVRTYLTKGKKSWYSPREYMSIQEWYSVKEPLPYYMAIFDERVTDFYGWVIPKGNTMILGAAMPKDHLEERFEQLKKDMTVKGFDVSCPIKRRGALILRPRPIKSVYTGRGHIFLAGEAAGLISPSSSEGISYALRSGEALAKAGFDRVHYEKNLTKLRFSIFVKCFKAPLMYNRWLRKVIFKTKLTSLTIAEQVKTYKKERWE